MKLNPKLSSSRAVPVKCIVINACVAPLDQDRLVGNTGYRQVYARSRRIAADVKRGVALIAGLGRAGFGCRALGVDGIKFSVVCVIRIEGDRYDSGSEALGIELPENFRENGVGSKFLGVLVQDI